MKRADLVAKLEAQGYKLIRHGSNHDIYSNGIKKETIPRHREVNEKLAKAILRRAGV